MDTARFIQLRKIFNEAVFLPASEWENFLQQACSDETLRAEVNELLLAHLNDASTRSTGVAEETGKTRMIGPYRIVRELGEGGMGVVYLAVRDDGAFRKNVAVKLLKQRHAVQGMVQRFHQERQVLANLDHPNIARLLDGGQAAEGVPYYVMEYVAGLALDRFCDSRKLDLAGRIELFQQVVLAVQYLHENLVVHRDLKHSNILVTADGTVKLLDFGIAKTQTPILESPDITGPANRLLTPNYASPEQIAGAPVSRASDIYSLGVILYELLTGRLPYPDAAAKLAGDPPLPSANIREDLQRTPETTAQLRRRIVGDLDQIVLLCLRRDPHHRYGSAAALGEDLQRFLDGRSVIARKEPLVEKVLRLVKRNRIAIAASALVLLLSGVGAWRTVQAQIETRQVEAREEAVRRLLDSLGHPGSPQSSAAHASHNSIGPASPAVAPIPRADDLRKLRRALEGDLAIAWALRPGDTPARRLLLEQTERYLQSVRAFAAQDSVLAVELAGAYKDLGVLYEPSSRSQALLEYGNAALLLQSSSGGSPEHGPASMQWAFIVARIRSLGGVVPVYRVVGMVTSGSTSIQPKRPSPPPATDTTADIKKAPEAAVIVLAPVDPAEYTLLKTRLDSAIAKGKLADDIMQSIEDDTRRQGQVVHPDIAANYERMNRALESARKALDSGDLPGARQNIAIAGECARRVLKEGGR